eukprot:2487483-Prymnesium_polylepis.1
MAVNPAFGEPPALRFSAKVFATREEAERAVQRADSAEGLAPWYLDEADDLHGRFNLRRPLAGVAEEGGGEPNGTISEE